MLDEGEAPTRAELAARVGVTAARVSQVFALLKLDQRIQDWIRSFPPGTPTRTVTERNCVPWCICRQRRSYGP